MSKARRSPIRGRNSLIATSMVLALVLVVLGLGSIAVVLSVRNSQRQVEATTSVITAYLGVSAALGGVALAEADSDRSSTWASSEQISQANERLGLAVDSLLSTADPADSATAQRVEHLYGQYRAELLSEQPEGAARADAHLRAMMGTTERAVALRRGRNQEVRRYEQQLVSVLTWLFPTGVAAGTFASVMCWQVMLRSHQAAVRSAKESRRQAARDPLTGLYNRSSLAENLDEAVRADQTCAIVAIDLDHFKEINDSYGHAKGDEVMMEVAYGLQAEVRPNDIVARIGGDEFVVLLRDVHDPAAVAERLRTAVAMVALRTGTRVSASIGVAGLDGRTAVEAMALADRALYGAKRSGRDAVITVAGVPSH